MSADGITVNLPQIYALSVNRWDQQWMNRQHLLSRLGARGWPVVYSSGALWIWQRHTPEWDSATWLWHADTEDHVVIARPSRLPPRWSGSPAYDRCAVRIHIKRLRQLGRHAPKLRPIFFAFDPEFAAYLDDMSDCRLVFHVRDAYDQMPGWDDSMRSAYERMQRQADLLTVCSPALVPTLLPEVRERCRVLNNGAPVEAVWAARDCPVPGDLAKIPRPRIGYCGAISMKLDLALIRTLALRHPEHQWVLVGPLRGCSYSAGDVASHDTLGLSNVHWLGLRPHHEIPSYISHMDVNVMPYITDDRPHGWARFAYPLKLHEYLATGLPVVSAVLPELRIHQDVLEMADGIEAWDAALARALRGQAPGTAEARCNVAAANSWDKRVDQLEAWLRELLVQR